MNLQTDKELYLFELDDVIYPKRDFLLQIYYLFSQFVSYTEGRAVAANMVEFMKDEYERYGEADILEKTKEKFELSADYAENFERLQVNGHLPVKLILFDEVKRTFAELIKRGSKIAILTKGNPVLQLNKLRHIEWEGWDQSIKIYFEDELVFRNLNPFEYIAQDLQINKESIHIYTK